MLKERILNVGSLVEESITNSINSLVNRDANLAQRVINDDSVIDQMEVEVEEECLKILALYQPVAADLRFVVAILKINNDLERIGDLARNIAKRAKSLASSDPIELPSQLREMTSAVQRMVKLSLDALVNGDAILARQVRTQDDAVDDEREQIRDQVMLLIKQKPERAEHLLKINSVSKHLERIADMATSIAEDVIYMVEGEIVRHKLKD